MERLKPPLKARVVAGISLTAAVLFACDSEDILEINKTRVQSPGATQTLPIPSTPRLIETVVISKTETSTVTASGKSLPTVKAEPMPTPNTSVNRALKLDGRLDAVEFDGEKYLFETPLRIEARFKLNNLGVGGNALVAKGENDAIAFFASLTSCPERGIAVVVAGGQAICGPSVQPGVWQEAVAEYDGEKVRIIKNNLEVVEKPWKGSVPIEQGKLFIGKSPSGLITQEFFEGEIDSLRIINAKTGNVLFNAQFSDFKDSATGNLGVAKGNAQLVPVN